MKKIIFFNSHPIQYFAPLYKKMAAEGMSVEVWYGSDESIRGMVDKQFGINVKWDIPLLEGYSYRFFKNHSPKPSIYRGFMGLMNLALLSAIFKEKKCLVIIYGWKYFSNVVLIIAAFIAGHQVGLRGESPLNQELLKGKKVLFLKKLILKYFLFRFIHYFLYIGKQNKDFYKYYGVKEKQLVFTPYAVDNERFQQAAKELLPQKKELRRELGIPIDAKVVLYSGKYIHKKRPLDLLQAYALLEEKNKALVMVGEGELREKMEIYIAKHELKNVFLTGFINQSEIVKYYAIADLFVMCSGPGETWGLSTNEAMNFGLPVILYDIIGCSDDLVQDNHKEFGLVPYGSISDLAQAIEKVIRNCLMNLSIDNTLLINQYSFAKIIDNLKFHAFESN